jgi:hypothetical protein
MCSVTNDAALPAPGFPIRRSAGQRLFSASPRLIAAVHVLLRLLVPRHPPCALTILTVSSIRARKHGWGDYPFWPLVQFSSSVEVGAADAFRSRSLKTEQRRVPSQLEPSPHGSGRRRSELRRHPAGPVDIRECLPRKEVIQPQLPLRLPCYDFTPITSPTFDSCLPEGLAHRLRVLPAFVV